MESKTGRAWIRKDIDRGAWYYDGEADLGNGAAIRIASTVITNDPLFGWIAYGGVLEQNKKGFNVIPRDGLRDRLSLVTEDVRTTITLNRDGFAVEKQISITPDLGRISFTLESRTADSHKTLLTINSQTPGKIKVTIDGRALTFTDGLNGQKEVLLPVTASSHKVMVTGIN
jgi:hypothetical protein